jgi:phage protein D
MTANATDQTAPAQELMEEGLPGTRFFAPQARFVDKKGKPILIAEQPDHPDLVSARVTHTHHGVAQVSLTLNNQRHDKDSLPLLPTWKYNRLDAIRFGLRVRVEFRYGKEKWVPMIRARITDVGFSFPEGGGSQLTLQGEDLLSLLKTKPDKDKRYRNKHEIEIVRNVLSRSNCKLPLAPARRENFQETLRTITHRKTQTYLQFIESIAERMDYEVFVDFDDRTDRDSEPRFHYEPSRSLALKGTVDLTWNKDLVSFRPKFKVWDVYTEAKISGRHSRRRQRIDEEVSQREIVRDLHRAPGGPMPINAIEARNRFFKGENRPERNTLPCEATNLDRARARLKAIAGLRKSARNFLTAEAATIGFTPLRPGIHVNIKNLYAPFDGIYYVTKAVHTIDANGYKTLCSLRRPGMLDPAGYPGG